MDCWDRWNEANEKIDRWIKEPAGWESREVCSNVEDMRQSALEIFDFFRDHIDSIKTSVRRALDS